MKSVLLSEDYLSTKDWGEYIKVKAINKYGINAIDKLKYMSKEDLKLIIYGCGLFERTDN